MSMLAERRRKQKWSLNPRGKDWAQDSNKFGQKLLEKMGWSQGKGLGANEDGRTEHVKVAYKNDVQGMGYKETDNQWTEHESNFSALLEALGGGNSETSELKLKSLEEKSQSSKARVHYKKFTRGKDLSKYSEKDLANIFGKKSLREILKAKKEQDKKDMEQENNSATEKDINFSNAGLMSDYFKKKLPNFAKTNGFVVGTNGVLKKSHDSESETEQRPSFGFGFNQNDKQSRTAESESESEMRPAFGFKQVNLNDNFCLRSNEKSTFISFVKDASGNDITETTQNKKKEKKKRCLKEEGTIVVETPSKKKKMESPGETSTKKKKVKCKVKKQENVGLSNPAFDPFTMPTKVEKHKLEPIEENIDDESVNSSLNDTIGQVAESFEVQVQINNEGTPVKRILDDSSDKHRIKKKKNKKENSTSILIEGKDLDNSNINESITSHSEIPKKKKRKSKSKDGQITELDTSVNGNAEDFNLSTGFVKEGKNISLLEVNVNENFTEANDINEEVEVPRKKKSKLKNSKENIAFKGIDNLFFDSSFEESSSISKSENPYEVKIQEKKKKKKKNDNFGLENPVFNCNDSISSQDFANDEYEVKRKGKKKKKKIAEEKGISNPALNLNDTIEESCDLMLNVVASPVSVNNTVSSQESASIKKVKGVERRKSVRFSDVTRERIIPTKEEIETETLDESRDIVEVHGKLNDGSDMSYIDKFIQRKKAKKKNKGLDNVAFDQHANALEENLNSISKTLDSYQAEIDNDINEKKLKTVEIDDIMVGEVGNPDGNNEILPDGTVKLKFRNANFKKTSKYVENLTGSKKSYKHLIKGDIIMGFKESNLHEIEGYAVKAN